MIILSSYHHQRCLAKWILESSPTLLRCVSGGEIYNGDPMGGFGLNIPTLKGHKALHNLIVDHRKPTLKINCPKVCMSVSRRIELS